MILRDAHPRKRNRYKLNGTMKKRNFIILSTSLVLCFAVVIKVFGVRVPPLMPPTLLIQQVGSTMNITITGNPATTLYVVQVTESMDAGASTSWSNLFVSVAANGAGVAACTDTNAAAFSQRFYRAYVYTNNF